MARRLHCSVGLRVTVMLPILALVAVLGLACAQAGTETASSAGSAANQRYTLRGVVIDSSELSASPRRLRLSHEAIPTFTAVDGELVGMDAMTMAMTLADSTAVPESLSVGDKVQCVLDVDWARSPAGLIVSVLRLPADTELVLAH